MSGRAFRRSRFNPIVRQKILFDRTGLWRVRADRYSVGVLVLITTFLLTLALGAALAKGVLTLVLRLLTDEPLPIMASFRIAVGALLALVR